MPTLYWILLTASVLTTGMVSNAGEQYPALNHDPEDALVGKRPYELDWAERHAPVHPQCMLFMLQHVCTRKAVVSAHMLKHEEHINAELARGPEQSATTDQKTGLPLARTKAISIVR